MKFISLLNKHYKSFIRAFCALSFIYTVIFLFSQAAFSASDIGRIKYTVSAPSENGYTAINFNTSYEEVSNNGVLKKASALPSKYDSRAKGIVTSVKDQKTFGSCWTFSAISASETSLINEFSAFKLENTDLSEVHHAYFSFAKASDPLKLTNGDYAVLKRDGFLDIGGNSYFSTFSLARWFGVADEAVAPYKNASSNTKLSSSLAYSKNKAVLENAYWVSMKDQSTVKKLLMKYGACTVSYYHDEMFLNTRTAGYYQRIYNYGNHSVTIIGWDDNYSRNNFGGLLGISKKPSKDGAWLIKNSFGTEYGDNGYIWVSYEDSSLFFDDAVFFDFTTTDTYDNNYQYDGSCAFASYYYKDKIYFSNVFKAQKEENLEAISFFTNSSSDSYKYQIYKNLKKSSDPTSGTPVFSSYVSCTPEYAGYNTVKLKQKVRLKKGDTFSVVIRAANKGKKVHALCDYSGYVDVQNTIYSHTSSSKGQSFVSENGKRWEDIYDNGSNENFRIKAFTKNVYIKLKTLTANVKSLKLPIDSSQKIALTVSPKNADASVVWTSADKSIAKVSSSGKITAVSYGKVKITYTSKINSDISGSITVTVVPKKVSNFKQSSATVSSYTLTWSKQKQASGYRIYKYNKKSKKKELVSDTVSNKYKLTGLDFGVKDTYYIAAYINITDKKSGKTKTYTSPLSSITAVTKPKSVDLSIKKVTSNSVTLKWTKSKNADIYYVYIYDAKLKKYKTVKKVTTTSATIGGLTANKAYKFAVRAKINNNTSTYSSAASNIVSAKTLQKK